MAKLDDVRHDILLILITGLFILFATGIALPIEFSTLPILIPS